MQVYNKLELLLISKNQNFVYPTEFQTKSLWMPLYMYFFHRHESLKTEIKIQNKVVEHRKPNGKIELG